MKKVVLKVGLYIVHEIIYPLLLAYLNKLLDKVEKLQSESAEQAKVDKVDQKAKKISDLVAKFFMLSLRMKVKGEAKK